jgi:pimeloyl-ACP methyl ester carboxylesterase
MDYAATNEVRLSAGTVRYRDLGSGEPLVFVHGLLVNGRLWEEVIPHLAGAHRCIVPDLPLGSHRTAMDPDAELSPPAIAALIAELIESLGLERVTLVGNDSGGAISQMLATTRPELVGRLVLTNCDCYDNFLPLLFRYLEVAAKVPGAMTVLTQTMRLKPMRRTPLAFGVLMKHRPDSELLDDWVRPGIEDPAVRRDAAKFLRGISPEQTLEAARKLPLFRSPALFAWAPEDRHFPIEHAERLAASMPDARVVPIEDSKTFVPRDQPQRLAEEIAAFIRDRDALAA